MKLLVAAERVPEDKALNYSFRLGVKFRKRPAAADVFDDRFLPPVAERLIN